MLQRLITGSCYILILILFYLAKIFLPGDWGVLAFDAMLYVFTLVGTWEMVRALGDRLPRVERDIVFGFAIVLLPLYDFSTLVIGTNGIAVIGGLVFCCALLLTTLFVAKNDEVTFENVGCTLFALIYPTVLITSIAICNHLPIYSDLAILMIFVISCCADSIAYVCGVTLGRKFPRKLAPVISPKKTIVGSIGGIIGGVLGALALFYVYHWMNGLAFNYVQLPVYLVIGGLGAVATEYGDLVESAIKRKLGIKDMGKILPGHGGLLDRIDGVLICAPLVCGIIYFCFSFLHIGC